MKTLDEVIKAVDGQHSLFELQGCFECHYSGDGNSCVGDCIMVDALHYLNEYRDLKETMDWHEEMENIRNNLTNLLMNPPLSWDELKQMEGKPVWVEERYRNGDLKSAGWWLIDYWNDDHICLRDQGGNSFNTYRGAYGRDWRAYRKERE